MARVSDHIVDVASDVGLGAECKLAVTVTVPEEDPGPRPVVCFAFPGGGYSRRYFHFDPPGSTDGGQAAWHADRGWIMVAVDHPGVGDSSQPDAPTLTLDNVAAADAAAVRAVTAGLCEGTLVPGMPPVSEPVLLGMGQSMGGCFLIVCQGQHALFDGIAVLGFSAVHTVVPSRPGDPPIAMPWMPRSASMTAPTVLNPASLTAVGNGGAGGGTPSGEPTAEHPFQWAFHFDDEDPAVVRTDMATPSAGQELPRWRSATIPPCAMQMVSPGVVAAEAASIRVPVLVAVGERDVVPHPRSEPAAYLSSPDVTVAVTERMAHMHNFAGSREKLWSRLHHWGQGVAAGVRNSPGAR